MQLELLPSEGDPGPADPVSNPLDPDHLANAIGILARLMAQTHQPQTIKENSHECPSQSTS